MKTIRSKVFETNSSSTHSVSFSSGFVRDQQLRCSNIRLGEFGWEYDPDRNDPNEKSSYLFTYLYLRGDDSQIQTVTDWVSEYSGMEITVEKTEYFYIDHQSIGELPNEVNLCDKDQVLDFLFCSCNSFTTDNDNGF